MSHKVNTRASILNYIAWYFENPGIKPKKQVEGKMEKKKSQKINNFTENNVAMPSKLRANYFQPGILS